MKNQLHPKTFHIYVPLWGGRYWAWILSKLCGRWLAGRPSIMIMHDVRYCALDINDKSK